ncbi:hypothetical protein CRM22_009782 [Opisthorchis felineus]|uniref:Uncharacterized protein n=1 Tax=Opisthorchis felineus TaxID=147828 RepID=A0A4S2LCC4_OPIFE|nr:hypothetical protein CRM22_009782 [Opisthorchis felineus]
MYRNVGNHQWSSTHKGNGQTTCTRERNTVETSDLSIQCLRWTCYSRDSSYFAQHLTFRDPLNPLIEKVECAEKRLYTTGQISDLAKVLSTMRQVKAHYEDQNSS